MQSWSDDAAELASQLRRVHPAVYAAMLEVRQGEEGVISTFETALRKMSGEDLIKKTLAYVAMLAASIPDNAMGAVVSLRKVVDMMLRLQWDADSFRAMEYEAHRLRKSVAEIGKTLGVSPASGRKRPMVDLVEARRLLADGVPLAKVARRFGVSRTTMYDLLR